MVIIEILHQTKLLLKISLTFWCRCGVFLWTSGDGPKNSTIWCWIVLWLSKIYTLAIIQYGPRTVKSIRNKKIASLTLARIECRRGGWFQRRTGPSRNVTWVYSSDRWTTKIQNDLKRNKKTYTTLFPLYYKFFHNISMHCTLTALHTVSHCCSVKSMYSMNYCVIRYKSQCSL